MVLQMDTETRRNEQQNLKCTVEERSAVGGGGNFTTQNIKYRHSQKSGFWNLSCKNVHIFLFTKQTEILMTLPHAPHHRHRPSQLHGLPMAPNFLNSSNTRMRRSTSVYHQSEKEDVTKQRRTSGLVHCPILCSPSSATPPLRRLRPQLSARLTQHSLPYGNTTRGFMSLTSQPPNELIPEPVQSASTLKTKFLKNYFKITPTSASWFRKQLSHDKPAIISWLPADFDFASQPM